MEGHEVASRSQQGEEAKVQMKAEGRVLLDIWTSPFCSKLDPPWVPFLEFLDPLQPRPIDSECISKKCHPVNKTSVFGMMDHQPPMSPLGPSPPSSPVGLEMKCHITYKMAKRNLGLHIA